MQLGKESYRNVFQALQVAPVLYILAQKEFSMELVEEVWNLEEAKWWIRRDLLKIGLLWGLWEGRQEGDTLRTWWAAVLYSKEK